MSEKPESKLRDHHLTSLGLLADFYAGNFSVQVPSDVKKEIENFIASAEALGLPVSVKRLRAGLPLTPAEPEEL